MFQQKQSGFTLLELIVAFTIATLLVTMSTPMVMRMYDSMVYRGAVKDMVSAIETTRYAAITQGQAIDITIVPTDNAFQVGQGENNYLPKSLKLTIEAAQEMSEIKGAGTIRYYPDGSSSGGSIQILRPSGQGVILHVDWLLGRLTQQPYDYLSNG